VVRIDLLGIALHLSAEVTLGGAHGFGWLLAGLFPLLLQVFAHLGTGFFALLLLLFAVFFELLLLAEFLLLFELLLLFLGHSFAIQLALDLLFLGHELFILLVLDLTKVVLNLVLLLSDSIYVLLLLLEHRWQLLALQVLALSSNFQAVLRGSAAVRCVASRILMDDLLLGWLCRRLRGRTNHGVVRSTLLDHIYLGEHIRCCSVNPD